MEILLINRRGWFLTLFMSVALFSYAIPFVVEAAVLAKPPNNLGLEGYWSFNEGTSTQATDFSGQLHPGTLSTSGSGLPQWTSGKRGTALAFDGVDEYVAVGNTNATVNTVSFWFKPDVSSSKQVMDLNGTVRIELNGSSQVTATNFTAPTVYVDGSSASSVVDTQWRHVVITTGTGISASAFDIGRVSTGYFDGVIDEVRLYSRVLTASEVLTLYGNTGAVRAHTSSQLLTSNTTLGSTGGLNGLWTFDGLDTLWTSATAGIAYDRSSNTNNGTFTNMNRATAPAIGKLGQALSFDGVDDSLSIAYSAALCPSSVSVSSWVYFTSMVTTTVSGGATVNEQYIYGKEHSNGFQNAYNLYKGNGPATLHFEIFANSAESTTAVEAGVWYHVLGTYDGSNIRMYINGVLERTAAYAGGYSCSTDPLIIGNRGIDLGGIYDAYFYGKIDDIRIYNRALSDAEARQLYNLGAVTVRP